MRTSFIVFLAAAMACLGPVAGPTHTSVLYAASTSDVATVFSRTTAMLTEPAALGLLGIALAGLGRALRRHRRRG